MQMRLLLFLQREAFQVVVWAFNSAQAVWNTQVLGYEVLNDTVVATIETDLTAVNASIISINANLTMLNISKDQTVSYLSFIATLASHATDISNLRVSASATIQRVNALGVSVANVNTRTVTLEISSGVLDTRTAQLGVSCSVLIPKLIY